MLINLDSFMNISFHRLNISFTVMCPGAVYFMQRFLIWLCKEVHVLTSVAIELWAVTSGCIKM